MTAFFKFLRTAITTHFQWLMAKPGGRARSTRPYSRAASGKHDFFIMSGIGKQRPEQRIVEAMAGFEPVETAQDRRPGQRQIAHRVQNLVADETAPQKHQGGGGGPLFPQPPGGF